MPLTSTGDFLDLLEKSRLLSTDALASARKLGSNLVEPLALAKELVKSSVLTRWQAQQLLGGQQPVTLTLELRPTMN